ncbi:MAG: hypothetical protein PHU59_03795, partial [Candidatus Omnitrophica bacterium]|nr:hypothetical protein [Candidatus Omnitrophota bacterium]
YGVDFDWDYCSKMSKKYKLCSCLYFILYQAEFLSGVKMPLEAGNKLRLSPLKKKLIQRFIEKNSFANQDSPALNKNLYLKSHFLLYDSFWEPLIYIFNIPREQFAKYYGFEPYAQRTNLLYHLRFIYIPFKAIFKLRGNEEE